MVSELIGPAVGSILTAAIGPHLAFLATIPSYFLSLVVMYFIKDEEPQATDACGLEQGEGNGLLDADYASSSTARSSRDYQSSSRGASPSRKHSMMEAVRFLRDDVWGLLLRASVLTGLLSLMVHRVYRPLLEVTIQYVSVRFGWKLRTVSIAIHQTRLDSFGTTGRRKAKERSNPRATSAPTPTKKRKGKRRKLEKRQRKGG